MKNKKIFLTLLSVVFFFIFCFCFKNVEATNTSLDINVNTFELVQTEVEQNGKVYFNFKSTGDKSRIAKIRVYGEVSGKFKIETFELKDLNTEKPYIEIGNAFENDTKIRISQIEIIGVKTGDYKIFYSDKQRKDVNSVGGVYNSNNKDSFTIKGASVLTELSIKDVKTNYNFNDKVYFNINQTGGELSYVSINIQNLDNGKTIIAYLKDVQVNPYLELSTLKLNNFVSGNYIIKDINMFYKNNPLKTVDVTNKNVKFNITDGTVKYIISDTELKTTALQQLYLKQGEVEVNGKADVELQTSLKPKKVMLNFSKEGETGISNMVVFVQSLGNAPYITIPYTTEVGTYKLVYAIITDSDGKEYHFRKGETLGDVEHFEFNSDVRIVESTKVEETKLEFDNEKITGEIIQKIKNAASNVAVTIRADNESVIDKSIFEAIKGTDKILIIKYGKDEWIFNGKDIKTVKDVDVNMTISKTDSSLGNIVQSGIILNFESNGELPGKCLVRVLATEEMRKILGTKEVYVYYYDETGKKLEKVAMKISLTEDGYYEFYINHNSKYLISTNEVDEQYVSDNNISLDGTDSSNTEVTNYNKAVIGGISTIAIILIILIIISVVMNRKKM